MFKLKIFASVVIFSFLLVGTSIIKNKTRELEKKIHYLSKEISLKEKDYKETELDFAYLSSPKMIEELKWKIPFYSYCGMLCFLNMPKKGDYAIVGFYHGAKLSNTQEKLMATDRKMIRHLLIESVEQANGRIFREILQEAILINETIQEAK